jgi:hypothetical protein
MPTQAAMLVLKRVEHPEAADHGERHGHHHQQRQAHLAELEVEERHHREQRPG